MSSGIPSRKHVSGRESPLPAAGIISIAALSIALLTVLLPLRTARGEDALALAESRFSAGDFTAAAGILKELIPRHPGDAGLHFLAGRCYYELRDYDNAVEEILRSVELAPGNSLYHQWLGRAYGGKADREKSFFLARKVKKELEKAVSLDPANIAARRDLQRFYTDAPWIVGGSLDKALNMVIAIEAIDGTEGRLARADYDLHALRDSTAAGREYREVLASASKRPEPFFEAADFFAEKDDAPALEQAVGAAGNAAPSDPRLSYYRGVAGIVAGGPSEHEEKLLRAYLAIPERSDWPSHADTRDWLGRLLERRGRKTEAAAEYRNALAEDPSRKETRARLRRVEKTLQH